MPIHLSENPYLGINAHLHSAFQNPGDSPSMWSAFHAAYLGHLRDALNTTLPDTYHAVAEQSLQIAIGPSQTARPRPDVTIYRDGDPLSVRSASSPTVAPTLTLALDETFFEPEWVNSIVIYRRAEAETHTALGEPIARLELLSPANKIGGSYYTPYMRNRFIALQSILVLVEIDYLHETDSPIYGIPPYPNVENAFAYSITLSNPRLPDIAKAAFVYGFGVDDEIPTLIIPLAGSDSVQLDFGKVYHHTFRVGRWGHVVDYAEEPLHIETYSASDQERIQARMAAIRSDHQPE